MLASIEFYRCTRDVRKPSQRTMLSPANGQCSVFYQIPCSSPEYDRSLWANQTCPADDRRSSNIGSALSSGHPDWDAHDGENRSCHACCPARHHDQGRPAYRLSSKRFTSINQLVLQSSLGMLTNRSIRSNEHPRRRWVRQAMHQQNRSLAWTSRCVRTAGYPMHLQYVAIVGGHVVHFNWISMVFYHVRLELVFFFWIHSHIQPVKHWHQYQLKFSPFKFESIKVDSTPAQTIAHNTHHWPHLLWHRRQNIVIHPAAIRIDLVDLIIAHQFGQFVVEQDRG